MTRLRTWRSRTRSSPGWGTAAVNFSTMKPLFPRARGIADEAGAARGRDLVMALATRPSAGRRRGGAPRRPCPGTPALLSLGAIARVVMTFLTTA